MFGLREVCSRIVHRSPPVRQVITGQQKTRLARAAVYVHFDPHGVVHDYVVHQVRSLAEAGFGVTFVTNSPKLPQASVASIIPICSAIIWRHNTGYDFGAYKDGISSVANLDQLDALVIMNDSVYGPFWPLSEVLARIDRTKTDFWGIADNWEHQYHLQSFFICFFSKTLRSAAFKRFWHRFPYVNTKSWIIRNGEIRLTQALGRDRLKGQALAPYWSIAEHMKSCFADLRNMTSEGWEQTTIDLAERAVLQGRPINPMHYFWEAMIRDFNCPFIKRELLQKNPANIPFTSRWEETITSLSSYDVSLVQRHLSQSGNAADHSDDEL
jgi:lipopolysaccharide biosynthesis protein